MSHCAYCHEPIDEGVHPYTLRLELFPAIEPSLQFSEKELAVDFEEELQRLVEMMERMDEAEVYRQEKLMYVSHSFMLCPACRDRLGELLDRLTPPPPHSPS